MNDESKPIRKTRRGYVLQNVYVRRELDLRAGRLATTAFTNLLTGTRAPVQSSEFEVKLHGRSEPLMQKHFTVRSHRAIEKGTVHALEFDLEHAGTGLTCRLRFEVPLKDFVMRKSLVVESGQRLVRDLCVESFEVAGFSFAYGGFGQPLFMDGEFFLGLEYPAGYNIVTGRRSVRLRHHPGKRGTVTSKTAVLGVCPNTPANRLRDWFLRYIEKHRARPVTRFDTQYMARCFPIREWKLGLAKKMFADNGLLVDGLYVHHSDTLYDRQSVSKLLPERHQKPCLKTLRRIAREKLGAGVGFHMNTGGGRGSADHAWFREHFDMISPSYYCLADPRVKERLQRNLTELIRKYDARFFSFDWLWWKTAWDCPHGGHRGHIKGVKYGREAITDAFIEMATAWRREKPDIIFEDLEVEHSPWWLFHADALWTYAGEGSRVSAPLIDGSIRGWTRTTVFPMNSIWYAVNPPYGWGPLPVPDREDLTEAQWQAYRRNQAGLHMVAGDTPPREWSDNVLMSFLRGSQINEIYYKLEHLTAEEKQLYAEIMHWALKHQKILLSNSSFILGDPARLDTYGVSHMLESHRGIIGVYNVCPWRNDTVRVSLDETAHVHDTGKPMTVDVVYPYRKRVGTGLHYGEAFDLAVPGKSLVVLQTRPAASGARRRLTSGIVQQPAGHRTGFSITSPQVQRDTGPRAKVHLDVDVQVPKDEVVHLHVLVDTVFDPRVFLATRRARKQYEALVAEFKRHVVEDRGGSWTPQKVAESRMTAMQTMLADMVVGRDVCTAREGRRAVALRSGSNTRHRLLRTGRHPVRTVEPYAFSWYRSEQPLSSGHLEVGLQPCWRHAACRIWLERERRTARAAPPPRGELPNRWHAGFRDIVTLLD